MELSEADLRRLAEAAVDYSTFTLNPNGLVAEWNRGAEHSSGYPAHEVVDSAYDVFFSEDERSVGIPAALLAQARKDGRVQTQGWQVRRDGTLFWAEVTLSVIRGRSNELSGFAVITHDLTSSHRSNSALVSAATTDSLTGLLNRQAFFERLRGMKNRGEQFFVAVIDLDGFKQINDTRGHAAGDAVLRGCAENLVRFADDDMMLGRMGGDEFAAAAAVRVGEDPLALIEQLVRVIGLPVMVDGEEMRIGSSVGVALFPRDGRDVSGLVMKADAAMYVAKKRGDTSAVLYTAGLLSRTSSQRSLDLQIRGALDHGEFALVYQPQVSLKDSSIVGYEALARWNHPRLGVLNPSMFIPLAEANGTILDLGAWVLRQACIDAARWPGNHRVAVNVSAIQLISDSFPQHVDQALYESGLEPSRLELEITESTLIAHKAIAGTTLDHLRTKGIQLALDDFGTGFSSLDILLAYDFDRVKIDRSVLREIRRSNRTAAVLEATLTLGHALAASVLVEGVETQAQYELLSELGFDEAQGYLIGHPTALDR